MTNKALKSRYRQQLFWYLKSIVIKPLLSKGLPFGSFTDEEISELNAIQFKINRLIEKQFDGAKEIGLKPLRRCWYCGKPASYKTIVLETNRYICQKCLPINQKSNPFTGEKYITNIEIIDPRD